MTHVCFADDLLTFCHGNRESVEVIMDAIDEFGAITGLLPNHSKSTIIFGSMNSEERQSILDVVPFKVEQLPVRYLGVPLSSKRIGMKECKSLVDKVQNRISSWKNGSLSYAGRLQLIALVLESIQVYWASVFLLPKTIIKDINKLLKNFLWNHGEVSRGKAKVAWKKVCKPKSQGGLGLKDLEVWNKATLVKNLWHVASDKNSLWVKWVNTVKLKGRNVWAVNEDVNDSWSWRTILKIRDEVKEFCVMKVGNGCRTSVWFDNWSNIGPLHSIITHRDIYNARMSTDMVLVELIRDGIWGWPFEWYEKYPIFNQIQTVTFSDNSDELMWKSKKGITRNFSIKQVYNDLQVEEESVSWSKLVWYTQNIPKHTFILWLAIQNKLVTQDKLKKWGTYDMMVCTLCYEAMDSHQHLFFDCKYAKQFWLKVCLKMGLSWEEMEWNDTINFFAEMDNGNTIKSIVRRLCLAASVYMIWKERNYRLFKEEKRSVDELFEVFKETVRLRLASLKAKPTSSVFKVQDDWNVQMVTKSNVIN